MNAKAAQPGKVLILSLAHLFNDWYMNLIQTLLPFLVAAGMSVSKGAFLVSAFTVTSSLLQPVFGYLVDQKNQRWLVYAGTIWMAVLLSLIGLIDNYVLLIAAVTLAGLGTSAFHPQASAMVTSVSGERRGFYQALFVAAGNVGWALTPLMVVPFITGYGLGWSYLLVLPGLLVGALLWVSAPKMPVLKKQAAARAGLWESLRPAAPELLKVVLVVATRSLTYFGLVTFLPLYLQHENISPLAGSRLLFLMLFTGALGGLLGGYISDIFGRRAVIVGSLVLATPLFYLYLSTAGALSYLFLALAGASLLASFSVTIVAAQEIIGKNAAMASGLMLGFGIGVGGLGVGLVGIMVAGSGIEAAVHFLIWLPVVAGLIGLTMRGKGRGPAVETTGGISVERR